MKKNWMLRFIEKINLSGDCWTWNGSLSRAGYGFFHLRGKTQLSHRMPSMQKGAGK